MTVMCASIWNREMQRTLHALHTAEQNGIEIKYSTAEKVELEEITERITVYNRIWKKRGFSPADYFDGFSWYLIRKYNLINLIQ